MKRLFLILAVALTASVRAPAQMEYRNGIVAIANESIITYQEVEMVVLPTMQSAAQTFGPNSEQFRMRVNEARADALQQLVERQLVLADFKSGGRVLPESIIDERIKEITRERYGDRVTLTKSLQAEGLTFEAFRQRTRDNIIYDVMDSHNVRAAVLVSPAKIERFYQTNVVRFKLADQVKLRMIVLKATPGNPPDDVRGVALGILRKIDEGAPFAEMASVYTEGSGKKDGGDWGWFEQSKLSGGFANIALTLQKGQHSGLFSQGREADDSYWIYRYDSAGRVISGRKYSAREAFIEERKFDQAGHDNLPARPGEFYLMLVDDKKEAHTRPLTEVRDEIERELLGQERARLRRQWVERLKSKSFVRYF